MIHLCFIHTSVSDSILSNCPSAAICCIASKCNGVLMGKLSLFSHQCLPLTSWAMPPNRRQYFQSSPQSIEILASRKINNSSGRDMHAFPHGDFIEVTCNTLMDFLSGSLLLYLKSRVTPGIHHGVEDRLLGPQDRLVPRASCKKKSTINLSNYSTMWHGSL